MCVSSEQNEMKKHIRLLDVYHWQIKRCVNGSLCEACDDADALSTATRTEHLSQCDDDSRPLSYVAGVDISFIKNDTVNACAACVVVKLPDFSVCIFVQFIYLRNSQLYRYANIHKLQLLMFICRTCKRNDSLRTTRY